MTSCLLLPYRIAGLPFRAVEKPYVQGMERVVYFLWDRVLGGDPEASMTMDHQQHHDHDPHHRHHKCGGSCRKDHGTDSSRHNCSHACSPSIPTNQLSSSPSSPPRRRWNDHVDDEIYTDLSHHLQSVGIDEVVRWMSRVEEQDVLFRRQPHQDYEKYPLLRFATWAAYDDDNDDEQEKNNKLQDIPLHYEDSSRERIPLGELAKTIRILSPTVLEIECGVHGGGIGGPEFVRRQLSNYCQLVAVHNEDKVGCTTARGPSRLSQEATVTATITNNRSRPAEDVLQFVLPNDASSIAEQASILEKRHNDLEQQIDTYYQNTKTVLTHAQHALTDETRFPPNHIESIVRAHRAAMQQELQLREKMAALMGDANSSTMVERYKQQMEEDSSMTEHEKVERGLDRLEQGRMEGLNKLQNVVEKVRRKVTGEVTIRPDRVQQQQQQQPQGKRQVAAADGENDEDYHVVLHGCYPSYWNDVQT